MEFTYEALNRQGQAINGKVVANSTAEAYEKLREAGVVVTTLTEQKVKAKKKSGKKVTLADMSLFSRQLAAMIGAGIPVTQAMSTLVAQTTNPTLSNAVKEIGEVYFTGCGNGEVEIICTTEKKEKSKVIMLSESEKVYRVNINNKGRLVKFRIENVKGSNITVKGFAAFMEMDED